MQSQQELYAENALEHQAVDRLMTRLRLNADKAAVREMSHAVEQNQLMFSAFHQRYPRFPVIFEVYRLPNARKKLTAAKLLTRFGQTPVARRYYRFLHDYQHMVDEGYELALVFSMPDLATEVDAISKARRANSVRACVLHAMTYGDDETPGTRIIWRADDSQLPPHVKLDPPCLVLESYASFTERLIAQYGDQAWR